MFNDNPFLNPRFPFHLMQAKTRKRKLAMWYFGSEIKQYQKQLRSTKESVWQKRGEQKALHLFHKAAIHVPAYKDFLYKNHIKPDLIKTFADFQSVPCTDKPSYISQYSLDQLCWHGKLEDSNIISFSSGSTGKPSLWPRGTYQDFEGAFAFEHLLTSLFHIDKKSTLFINSFSLGNYVAGMYVYTSTKLLSQKGYPLTIVSPGISYQDLFNMLSRLDSKYEQIILAGYPPFIRDVIDLGNKENFDFSKLNLKFFFASEFFSEDWRNYTLNLANNTRPLTDSTNIYGTADSAIFSFETPSAILIRKLIQHEPAINQALFHSKLTPTLTQYNPLLTFYESINEELTLTSASGIPLIRYNLKDHGGVLTNQQIDTTLAGYQLNLDAELQSQNLEAIRYQLPYSYVTNRTDGAVSFYAIKIFPEYARSGIESSSLHNSLSGRFTLISTEDSYHAPQLIIHAELNTGVNPTESLERQVFQSVFDSLLSHCSEYSFLENSIGSKAYPKIVLHPKGNSEYFQNGIKQKWISA
jgi:phenylacetate-CoA ligase